ncbi:unnamed protein product [Rhizoctonia solani]|uniref:BTB domain-containing protein n=1 Tax=Rhizoctonia solani TaxID=456999 RepID=A0A8H3AFQ9_9AGAM|nr:unnamed protein product [Rhizoctonia solani]
MPRQSTSTGAVGNTMSGETQIDLTNLTGPSRTVTAFVYNSAYSPSNESDMVIRCTDNVRFSLRFTVLRVFFPWLIGNNPPNSASPIEFPYSSGVLNLIFRFTGNQTFQPDQETAGTWNFVNDCFQAASRYGLYSLFTCLRFELASSTSAFYLGRNPIAAYALCNAYQFEVEKQQAFENCISQLDFCNKSAIDTVIRECTDIKIALELISRLTRRSAVITQLFSDLHVYPMDTRSNYWKLGPFGRDAPQYGDLTCLNCQDSTIFGAPSWLSFWAYRAKNELLKTPGEECGHIFKVDYLGRRVTYLQVFGGEQEDSELEATRLNEEVTACQECLRLILLEKSSIWEEWASRVQGYLRFELGDDL